MTRLLLEINEPLGDVECDNTWYQDPHQGDAKCVGGLMVSVSTLLVLKKQLSVGETEIVCTLCHGKGTRPAWLRGMVETWLDIEGHSTVVLLGVRYTNIRAAINPLKMPYGNKEELVEALLEAHKAGTLPDSLYKSDKNPMGLEVCYEPE